MKGSELIKWFQEEVLVALLKNGQLMTDGEVESIQECEFENMETGVCSFASVPSFAKITLNTNTGLLVREIFIKFQSQLPIFREKMKLDLQFQNEVAMYTKVLPGFMNFLKDCGRNPNLVNDITPKCYLAFKHENPDKSIVVLEDLRSQGYRLTDLVTELDKDHCIKAFERLGQFHGISYAMKFRNSELFEELKNSFVKVWTADDSWTRNQCEDFRGSCLQRGIEYLMSQKDSEVPLSYLENLKKILHPAGLLDFLTNVSSPKEPLSVICHGDFNRNNVLYKYNQGKIVDAKLVDFQTFVYGPPSLDLSFFIYMNTTLEFREKHFDDILKHYHSSLVKTVSLILGETEESIRNRLPFEEFMKDFARVAITAYVTVSFFIPAMMAPPSSDFEEDLINKDFKTLALENMALGGEVVSKRIAEVIVDFYRRKFYV